MTCSQLQRPMAGYVTQSTTIKLPSDFFAPRSAAILAFGLDNGIGSSSPVGLLFSFFLCSFHPALEQFMSAATPNMMCMQAMRQLCIRRCYYAGRSPAQLITPVCIVVDPQVGVNPHLYTSTGSIQQANPHCQGGQKEQFVRDSGVCV